LTHTLFDEFHELAQRDHVPDEYLRNMAMVHAAQIAELRATELIFPNLAGKPADPDSLLRRAILPALEVCEI